MTEEHYEVESYAVGIQRLPDGGVQLWLHCRYSEESPISQDSVSVRYFFPNEAAHWSDGEVRQVANEWARGVLDEIGEQDAILQQA